MNAVNAKPGGTSNKNVILIVATTTSFILPFLVASVNVALPTMGREFGMEAVVMSWVSTVYFLAVAMSQVPFGRLSDIFGRRRLFILGLVIASVASFIGGVANSVALLMVSRALQGLGAGMCFNNSVAILSSVFPSTERGRALGISMAGTYAGISMGPLLGGVLTEYLGWRSIFYTSGILGILLFVLVSLALKGEWREARGEKFDLVGSITFSVSIAVFMYGFSVLPTTLGFILFVAGALGLYLFVRLEARTSSPVFHIDLFRRNRVFFFSNLAALITYISTFAVTFLLSLYLQYIKGYTAETAGLVLIASSLVMAIFTPISGHISDRVEPRVVATVGMAVTCIALVMLIFLANTTGVWYIVIALVFLGVGIGLFASPNTNAVMGSVEPRLLALASGTQGTMRTSGMMLSMGIMMVLFSLYIGQAEITPASYPQFLASLRTGFIIFTLLGIGGVIAQLVARQPPGKVEARGASKSTAVH
jgi:EmrB/QacA subfamily drug resistance transporter